jgi:short subunit dehydrogenase-like uncharacterized protein
MTSASARRAGAAPVIAVFGATGVVGRRVCAELAAMRPAGSAGSAGTAGATRPTSVTGAAIAIVGRRRDALAELASAIPVVSEHVATASEPAALDRAFAGARVVVNAAGPLRDTAAQVLAAAIAAGAHYVDVGGEQAVLQASYELHESAVRRAGLVALPGAGLDCAIGDLAAAWAAQQLIGARDPPGAPAAPGAPGAPAAGDPLRDAPVERLAEAEPLDDIAVSYLFDQLALSAGSQRAAFGAIGARPAVWYRDRWEPGRAGESRRVNGGAALGGEREAVTYAGGDAITIPRHVAARRVASFLSAARSAGASAALRLLSRALPFVPRRAGELLVPYAAPESERDRTRFAVVAQVRRGFEALQVVVRGHDVYRTTAAITAWAALRLAERAAGPTGMLAPAELFHPEPALREIASIADLTIEPSFG